MTQFKFNYFVIGVVSLLLALALWPNISWHSNQHGKLSQIKARGELRISTMDSPLIYSTDKEGPSGFDYELAKSFAKYLGVKLTVSIHNNIDNMFDALHDDKTDLLVAGLIQNDERLSRAYISPTYYSVSQQLVYRKGLPRPKSFHDLKGKLTVAAGSAHMTKLKQLQQTGYPDLTFELSTEYSSKQLLEQVIEGKLDYTVGDSMTIALLQRIHPQLTVAFDVTDEEPVSWFFKRTDDDSLYAAMLDFYSHMAEEGSIARLEEKYLGHVGKFDYVDTKVFLNAIDTVLPTFRPLFEKYAAQIDWKLLAVIAYQESHWNPQAVSPTGVRGLMMLTNATASWVGINNRLDPEESVKGGAAYLKSLMEKIPETVPQDERIWFALAAYNMGYGHMLDARQLTKKQHGDPDSWVHVKMRLPMLSQKRYYQDTVYGYARGHEAYKYVENIRRYQLSLVGHLQAREKKLAEQLINTSSDSGYSVVNSGWLAEQP